MLTVLNALGLDVKKRDLPALRQHFAQWKVEDFTTRCLELANVRKVCMTNSPFDDLERPVWERGFARDPRFVAALRIDPLLLDWENTAPKLHAWGYDVRADFSGQTFDEVRRFLARLDEADRRAVLHGLAHAGLRLSRATRRRRNSSSTRSCRTGASTGRPLR